MIYLTNLEVRLRVGDKKKKKKKKNCLFFSLKHGEIFSLRDNAAN